MKASQVKKMPEKKKPASGNTVSGVVRKAGSNRPPAKSGPVKLTSLNSRKVNPSPDIRGSHNAILPEIKKGTTKSAVVVFDEILEGKLQNLPPKPPSEVRIFLSSTFSDLRIERNWLAKEAYPKLKEFCYNELQVDFSVVDMRWGITDDATNEHSTEELCLREIANCQRMGLGPTFVTMLGDRYGFRPIPSFIEAEEFRIISREAVIYEKPKQELLKQWYQLDTNAVPHQFVLQPISSLIPGFGDHSNETLAKQAREQWNMVLETLAEMLRMCVDSAIKKDHLPKHRSHDYHKSVTEFEIQDGLFNNPNPSSHCLGFIRRFTGLDNRSLKENLATVQRYTDVKAQYGNKVIDLEAETLRNSLQRGRVPERLSKESLFQYQIPWQPEGVKPEKYDEHFNYVRNFCGDFINGILTLISKEKYRLDSQIPTTEYYTDYSDLLHHLHFCKKKCENFRGQSDIIDKVRSYVTNPKNRAPLILYADSGGGKTSLMAKIFMELPSWFEQEGFGVTRIIRFLGTSPLSTNIYNVLRAVAGQTADVYDHIMEPVGYKTMKGIVKYLPRFLRNISRTTKQHIFILLDSIDQLSSGNEAYKMKWLPTDMPSNVHIIISMLPSLHSILANTRQLNLPEESFIEVPPLKQETGKEIISSHLNRKKRTLTPHQESMVLSALEKVPNPLFLKLLIDRSLTWKSYTPMGDVEIASSVRSAINHLFADLEQKFGQVLISHTLGYLTIGLNGLTEVELEDILSCDDEVLDEVYQYHNPPVEGIVRIPPVTWARIRHSIEEYITERSSQGKTTLYWYHRQFIEAAEDRYTQDNFRKVLHGNLASLYQSENGFIKDITLSKRKVTIPDADRQITSHPLVISNVRTLMALPYHLRRTEDFSQLKDITLCNIKFLMTKIKAVGLESVLQDFTDATYTDEDTGHVVSDSDLQIVYNCLNEMYTHGKKASQLPTELLTRIPDDDYWLPFATKLVRECRLHIQQQKKASVIPLFPCLYDKIPLMDTIPNILAVLQQEGDTLVMKCAGKEGPLVFKVLNYGETSVNVLYEGVSAYKPILTRDRESVLLYNIMNVINKVGSASTSVEIEFTENQMLTKSPEKTFKIAVICERKVGSDFDLKCFDVCGTSHTFLACCGQEDVAVVNFNKDKCLAHYRVVSNTNRSANPNQLVVQGDSPEFLYCKLTHGGQKNVVVMQSCEGDSYWTSLNVHTLDQPIRQAVQIPGKAIAERWSFVREEKYFVLPVCDHDGTTRISLFDLQDGKNQSLKVKESHVKDISVGSIGELLCYVLTQDGVFVYDLIKQVEISSLPLMLDSPCTLTVEEDGQHLYIGDTDGTVSVWNPDGFKELGFISFQSGPVERVVLSSSDATVIILSGSHVVYAMDQKQFMEQCKKNLQILRTGRKDNNKDLVTLKTASLLLFTESDILSELISCECGEFQYWDLGSLEHEQVIHYGTSYEDFTPNRVIHNTLVSSPKYMLYDKQHAVIIDVNNRVVDFKILVPDNGVVAAAATADGFYMVTRIDGKLSANLIDASTGEITRTIQIKEALKSEDIEIKITASGRYMVFKVLCSDKEWEIIRNSEKKGLNMRMSEGRYKVLALDLTAEKPTLIPCYRQLTKIICLCDSFEIYKENLVILGRMRKTVIWNIQTANNDQRLVKGTKIPVFFRPIWIEDDSDWGSICHGMILAMELRGPPGKEVLAMASADGWLTIYDAEGRCVNPKMGKIPNNKSPVEKVAVSPNGLWVVSVNRAHVLKCWAVREQGQEIFSIKLNVKVKEFTFNPSGDYLAVLGERNDKTTKVLLFHIMGAK